MSLGVGYGRLGEFDKADEAIKRAQEVAQGGDLIARLDALIGESMVKSMRGDLEGAVPLAMRCTNMAEEAGATACVVASNLVLGDSYMRQGNFGDAKIAIDRGSEVAEVTGQRMFRPSIAAYRRNLAASMGTYTLQGRTFEEALAEAQELSDGWAVANIIWRRAETEVAKPDADRAQMFSDYATAAAQFEEMDARPVLARVLRDWGKALQSAGNQDDGREKLNRAQTLFEEMGLTREATEVSEELAAT
jgi:tetratricopeptide (TPR) repeat protein